MSTKNNDKRVTDLGKSNGYNSSNYQSGRLVNGSGGFCQTSASGKSYNLNGYRYNSLSDLEKSTKWFR